MLSKGRRIGKVSVAVDDVVREVGRTQRRENGIHLGESATQIAINVVATIAATNPLCWRRVRRSPSTSRASITVAIG